MGYIRIKGVESLKKEVKKRRKFIDKVAIKLL
jgi:hypothetical protein